MDEQNRTHPRHERDGLDDLPAPMTSNGTSEQGTSTKLALVAALSTNPERMFSPRSPSNGATSLQNLQKPLAESLPLITTKRVACL